jgi:hypothetical protein
MLLLWDSPGQTTELVFHALNLEQRRFALLAIYLRNGRACQATGSAVHNRCRHLQIAQEFGGRRCRSFRFRLPLRFEKQRGLVEKALADHWWAATPGGIQLPGLPGVAVMLGERRSHPLAVLQVDTGYRHQELHRYVRGDFTLAHLLLDCLRQKFDQRQPPRYPAHAAIKPSCQFIEAVAEALLHLRQQPALLQRGLVLGETQRTFQQQSLGLTHRPDHRFHRVPAQLFKRRDALVAVDDQITAGLAFGRHHDNRRLLARLSQRCHQAPLPVRPADSQVFPSPVELVKLQLHGRLRVQYGPSRDWSFAAEGGVCRESSSNQADTSGTGLSRSGLLVLP